MELDQIKGLIRDVADFPQEGIVFKDITPVLALLKEREPRYRQLQERTVAREAIKARRAAEAPAPVSAEAKATVSAAAASRTTARTGTSQRPRPKSKRKLPAKRKRR